MKNECQNPKKQGDCITRNAKTLCDFCDSLLSDDERTHREIARFVADCERKAARPSEACLTIRKNGTDRRTCREKNLTNLCPFCCAQMTHRQLLAHATTIINERNEHRAYWQEQVESDEYAQELKDAEVVGIDWNIESDYGEADSRDYTNRTAIIFFLFAFGKPCWNHTLKGWIKHECKKRKARNRVTEAHLNQPSQAHC